MKKRSLFGIICACIISFSLCGCANESEKIKSESVETVESVTETVDAEILNMEIEEAYQTDDISKMEVTKTDNETIEEVEKLFFEKALDWAIYVDAEEPQLTIWNSESKQGIILENGGEYLVKEGDVLAGYYGDIEKCMLVSVECMLVSVEPFDFCSGLTYFGNCDILEDIVLPEESQTINLGLEFCDFSRNEFFTYYFTITTP